jgi:hypothetical protein
MIERGHDDPFFYEKILHNIHNKSRNANLPDTAGDDSTDRGTA